MLKKNTQPLYLDGYSRPRAVESESGPAWQKGSCIFSSYFFKYHFQFEMLNRNVCSSEEFNVYTIAERNLYSNFMSYIHVIVKTECTHNIYI